MVRRSLLAALPALPLAMVLPPTLPPSLEKKVARAILESTCGGVDQPTMGQAGSLAQRATAVPSLLSEGESREGLLLQAQNLTFRQLKNAWSQGFWTQDVFYQHAMSAPEPSCGRATFEELSMPIPEWRAKNPGVDAFCHFQNFAMWFANAGQASKTNYEVYGRGGLSVRGASCICDSLGENVGPPRELTYDGGHLRWRNLDTCIDLIDDPYCYSMGWLKGQREDIPWNLMTNSSAWFQVGQQECARMQQEFGFRDEDVTVGRHVATTPFYFAGALCAMEGTCAPVTRRTHNEHVYTKCQLGDGAQEMAYCYYKGCVMEDGAIGHGVEQCKYSFGHPY